MKKSRQVIAGILVMAMAIIGIPSILEVKATEEGVFYEAVDMKVSWENNKIAPTKPNYVFGGWFKLEGDGITYTALKEADIDTNGDGIVDYTGITYAKWVPAYVLSIKAQIDKNTQDNSGVTGTNKAYLRVISAVDSTDYQMIGFDLFYDKEYKETEDTTITKVYESIKNDESGTEPWMPEQIFGPAADLFSVLKVSGISSDNCDNILYVRPYWVTMDGTRVEGLSKYVRVMDGYNADPLISVPVNLLTGSPVAAGQMELIYDTDLEVAGFESGMLMAEMGYYDDKEGIVKIVGNINGIADVEPEKDIYANVWFRVKNTTTDNTHWEFQLKNLSF